MLNSAGSKDFVQEIIHAALNDQLGGKVYDANKVSQWSKNIADNVKSQVKTLGYDRYKIVVEVVIGEQRGEGVRMGSRCLIISFPRFGKLFSQHLYACFSSALCTAHEFGHFSSVLIWTV